MCMKRNELSSNRRSKTEMGACAQDRSGFIPSAASTIRWRARRAQLGVAPPVGGPQHPRVEAEGKVARGTAQKMLKMKIDPTMCMKTNKTDDNLPDTKDDISTQLHAILQRSTRILQKPSAHLSLFVRWGTNPSPPCVETRRASRAGPGPTPVRSNDARESTPGRATQYGPRPLALWITFF